MKDLDGSENSREDIDLVNEVSLIAIAVVGGIASLAYSIELAMIFCLGMLFLCAGWFAISPEMGKARRADQPRELHR